MLLYVSDLAEAQLIFAVIESESPDLLAQARGF